MNGQGLDFVEIVQAMSEMGHQLGSECDVNTGSGGQAAGNFVGGMSESSTETIRFNDWAAGDKALLTAKFVQVVDGQFEDVGFFQLGDVLAFGLEGIHHEILEFVETTIDASTTFALKHWLHDFAVLVGAGDGLQGAGAAAAAVAGDVLDDHRR